MTLDNSLRLINRTALLIRPSTVTRHFVVSWVSRRGWTSRALQRSLRSIKHMAALIRRFMKTHLLRCQVAAAVEARVRSEMARKWREEWISALAHAL